MIFGPNHYVPVLKVKPGEKEALAALAPVVAAHVTPLLEIVEIEPGRPLSKHLDLAFKDLPMAVQGLARYFIDSREIASAGPPAAVDVFVRARALGRPFTPVTGISRTADVVAALGAGGEGVAIRVTREEYERGIVPTALSGFMTTHTLAPEEVDLFVDLGAVEDMVVAGISRLSAQFLRVIPHVGTWRTFSILASAFPASMGVVGRNSHDLVDRAEWLSWRDALYPRRGTLGRLPTFGDCAIQHPRGVERLDFTKVKISASIRYTLPDQWLLVKGESTRSTLPSIQFPTLAAKLTTGVLSAHFAGAGHCAGCYLIEQAAANAPRLGSLGAWRRIGTIHHLTRTVEQIRALAWP